MKNIEQALKDKVLYIGNEMPKSFFNDPRRKFVILGTPKELIDETAINCACQEPWTLGVIHRKDKPCYWPAPDQKN